MTRSDAPGAVLKALDELGERLELGRLPQLFSFLYTTWPSGQAGVFGIGLMTVSSIGEVTPKLPSTEALFQTLT